MKVTKHWQTSSETHGQPCIRFTDDDHVKKSRRWFLYRFWEFPSQNYVEANPNRAHKSWEREKSIELVNKCTYETGREFPTITARSIVFRKGGAVDITQTIF